MAKKKNESKPKSQEFGMELPKRKEKTKPKVTKPKDKK